MRVTDLSKPIEAESKLGSAPVDPSEFCDSYIYIHTRDEAEFKLGSAPVVPSELCYTYIHTYIHTKPAETTPIRAAPQRARIRFGAMHLQGRGRVRAAATPH